MKNFFAALTALALATVPLFAASTQIQDEGNGYQIGTTPQQKVGFYGAAPVAQSSGASQAAVTITAATGTLTFTAQPSATETVTVGSKTYTFKTSLASANDVLIGTTEAASLANLAGAINASSSGGQVAGTTYGTSTTANAYVTATSTSTTVVVTAIVPGTAGNSIASTETSASASWGGSTLAGGVDATANADAILLNSIRASLVAQGLMKGSS